VIKKTVAVFALVFLSPLVFGESANDRIDETARRDTTGIETTDPLELWAQFLLTSNTDRMAQILITLGTLGKGNRQIIDNLNNHLMGNNLLFRSGADVHYTVVSANIAAIMELGDSSSYPALFSVLYAGYPEVIAWEALGALEVIPGNLFQFLINVIRNNPPDEKFAAFRVGMSIDRLSVSEKGRLAETALEQALTDTANNIDMNFMRYAAINNLAQMRWTRANALAIRHYYRVQSDFHQGNASKMRFIDAIACLGALGNSDAALVLGLQLGLINARTESTGIFDPELTMAIVQALGSIGFSAAFDHLLTVSNLPYPEDIVAAAGEAISRLRW